MRDKKIKLIKSKFQSFKLNGFYFNNCKKQIKNDQNQLFFGIILNKKNVGNIVISKYSKFTIMIDAIKIKKQYQHKGFGTQAISILLKKYPKKDFCLNGIKTASNFYKKLGFKQTKNSKSKNCYEFELLRNFE